MKSEVLTSYKAICIAKDVYCDYKQKHEKYDLKLFVFYDAIKLPLTYYHDWRIEKDGNSYYFYEGTFYKCFRLVEDEICSEKNAVNMLGSCGY